METTLDPTNPNSFRWKSFIVTSGHTYRYIDQNEASKEVVLCLHGFPDLAFGWRYQILELVRRGYRVIAPDLLGYGGTSKPTDVQAYTFLRVCRSLCEILDHSQVKKVVVVGHDWGAPLSGRFFLHFPDRVRAWVTVCVPPRPAPSADSVPVDWPAMIRSTFPNFGYQLYLMSDIAEEELTRYAKTFLLVTCCHMAARLADKRARSAAVEAATRQPSFVLEGVIRERVMEYRHVLEPAEVFDPVIEYYIGAFRCHGLAAPLKWYKTRNLNFADDQAARLPQTFPNIPSLFLRASEDEALPLSLVSDEQLLSAFPGHNLDIVTLEGANHWLLQDPKDRDLFTSTLCDWIDRHTKTITAKL